MKYLFIASFIIFLTASCKKDFLDVPNKTAIFRQAYITDLATTNSYLNGIYIELASNFYNGYHFIYPDLIADNIKPAAIGVKPLAAQYRWSQQSNDVRASTVSNETVNMNPMWLSGYGVVRDCNYIIENVDKYSNENPVKASDIKGQAFAIRALVHFVLMNTFSQPYSYTGNGSHIGIPFITTSDYTQPVTRISVGEVYEHLIADLNTAIELLPSTPSTVALDNKNYVINKNAVKALLARIYLFKEDFAMAKSLAREVSLAVPIMTGSANYPAKLFTPQETEALFQLPPAWVGASGGGGSYYYYNEGLYFATPLLQFVATNDLASVLNENASDSRRAWISLVGSTWNIIKFSKNLYSGYAAPTLAYYQTILRSSEMYLTAAESYAKLNQEDSARFFLNAIRLRANPTASLVVETGPSLLDSIYKERRKEFAFEGGRVYDLLRLKKSINRIDAYEPTSQSLSFPNDKAIAPLPLSDVNQSGLQQNAGY